MQLSRINLLLGAVVALLAVIASFTLMPDKDLAVTPLTGLDPASVRHVRIDRGDGDVLEFKRRPTGWHMTLPYSRSADTGKLHAVARIAAAPSRRRFPAAGTDPTELGFSPPPIRLKLDGELLEIGGTEPIRRRRYVRIGDWIHLIDDLFQHHLLAAPEAFIPSAHARQEAD
jgi:hypothetical protein